MSRPSRRGFRAGTTALVAVLMFTLFAPDAGASPAGPTTSRQPRAAAENYVTYVYDSLLFREVDPEGLTYWAGIINTQGTGAFINFVVNSPEWRKVWVDAFYDSVWLNRPVDAGSVDYWEWYLQAHRFDGFELLLAVSPEAYAVAGGTPAAYVEYLFQKTWLRSPTPDEAADAQAIIDEAGTKALLEALLLSDEGLATRVTIAYGRALDRAPDVGGIGYWMGFYDATGSMSQMLAGLILSPEAWQKAQDPGVAADDIRTLITR